MMKEITLIEQKTEDAISHRMPPLDEASRQEKTGEDHRRWARGLMEHLTNGQAYNQNDCGITLQRVNENTMRCIAVVEHSYPYLSLAEMSVSFEAAGIELQIDPYTVAIPYNEPPEQEAQQDPPPEAPGPEVV